MLKLPKFLGGGLVKPPSVGGDIQGTVLRESSLRPDVLQLEAEVTSRIEGTRSDDALRGMIGVGQPVPPTDIEVSITTGDAPDQDVSGWSNVQIFFRGQETIVRVGSWKPGVSMTAVDRALQTAARDIMTASRRAAQEIRERDKLLGVL